MAIQGVDWKYLSAYPEAAWRGDFAGMFSAGNVPGGVQEASKALGTGREGGGGGASGAPCSRKERPGDAFQSQTGAELRQDIAKKLCILMNKNCCEKLYQVNSLSLSDCNLPFPQYENIRPSIVLLGSFGSRPLPGRMLQTVGTNCYPKGKS
jgi:hypothetical protein